MARKLTGMVTSDVQDKTITVAVARSVTHPLYGKRYSITKKYAVHDAENQAHIGDKVEIIESRPISKRKSWVLSKIAETGHAAVELKDDIKSEAPAKAEKPAVTKAKTKLKANDSKP